MVPIQDTGLCLNANSVMVAITAPPQMAQLSVERVRKDITAYVETPLLDPSRGLRVTSTPAVPLVYNLTTRLTLI